MFQGSNSIFNLIIVEICNFVKHRGERMNAKIRDAQNQKIPYMLVVGDKEAQDGAVALRLRSGENPGAIPLADFLARASKEIEEGV